jgi:PiT family inorganic phosphate transporter
LIGGLCGAALASSHGRWAAIIWSQPAHPWFKGAGVFWKVIVPMVTSPVLGFIGAFALLALLYAIIVGISRLGGPLSRLARPRWVNAFFRKAQLGSAAYMGFAHGSNDAQKTMGIITSVLVTSGFQKTFDVRIWVILAAHAAIALGTLSGGWRIVHTMGGRLTRLKPRSGFCAETGAATAVLLATRLGLPVSTTHAIAGAITGVGSIHRLKAVRWGIATNIVWAWVMTIPAAAIIAWLCFMVLHVVLSVA